MSESAKLVPVFPSDRALVARSPNASQRAASVVTRSDGPRTPKAIARLQDTFFSIVNPIAPTNRAGLRLREIPHFYGKEVVQKAATQLSALVENGGRLFVQGVGRQVGVTTFLSDWQTAFNAGAEEIGDPRRVLYFRVPFGTGSVRQFLDDLATEVDLDFTDAELGRRGIRRLTGLLTTAMTMGRYVTLILDEVHHLPPKVLPFLHEIIHATDPVANGVGGDRLGVVLASHETIDRLFAHQSGIRRALRGNLVKLGRYRSLDAVGEAIRSADIGLDDLDLTSSADRDLVRRVLEVTEGLPSAMNPLFQYVGALARLNATRPDLDLIEAALEEYNAELLKSRQARAVEVGTPDAADESINQMRATSSAPGPSAGREESDVRHDGPVRSAEQAQMLKQMNHTNFGDELISRRRVRRTR